MKKLVLVAAVAFSASLFSCGSSDKAAEAAAEDSAVVAEEVVVAEVDTLAGDSLEVAVDTTVVVENN